MKKYRIVSKMDELEKTLLFYPEFKNKASQWVRFQRNILEPYVYFDTLCEAYHFLDDEVEFGEITRNYGIQIHEYPKRKQYES